MRRIAPSACLLLVLLTAGWPLSIAAQTFSVLHDFGAGSDGASPAAGVTVDTRGNLYGTAGSGGDRGGGVVFKMVYQASGWSFTPLYSFDTRSPGNGIGPESPVVIGPNGSLYGTTDIGGIAGQGCETYGCGVVYNLRPSPRVSSSVLGLWTETVLYSFEGNPDGAHSVAGVIFDAAGNIFGTTLQGGTSNWGTAYELSPRQGGWSEQVLHSFTNGNDGGYLNGALVLDRAGSLYGLANSGGVNGNGTVFRLTLSGASWMETTLYAFPGQGLNGENPSGGLIFDGLGNLYGATSDGGPHSGGTAFQMTPQHDGSWAHNLLYGFAFSGTTTPGPLCSLTLGSNGNLYGTTFGDGAYGFGSVFSLMPNADGTWTYTDLHDFTGGSDGRYPAGSIAFDPAGNLYGTTTGGGAIGYGVVFEITP